MKHLNNKDLLGAAILGGLCLAIIVALFVRQAVHTIKPVTIVRSPSPTATPSATPTPRVVSNGRFAPVAAPTPTQRPRGDQGVTQTTTVDNRPASVPTTPPNPTQRPTPTSFIDLPVVDLSLPGLGGVAR